jgi:primary-amine oxidase
LTTSSGAARATTHPLDPLTAEEIERAVAVVRREIADHDDLRFCLVTLSEPSKQAVLDWDGAAAFDRRVLFALIDPRVPAATEAIVSLADDAIVAQRPLALTEPPMTHPELDIATAACMADERFVAGLRRRGIEDDELVVVESHAVGTALAGDHPDRRLMRALVYLRGKPGDSYWARPVAGLHALVDVIDGSVLEVEDGEIVPIATESANYWGDELPAQRDDLRPIEVNQPDGVSFTVDGHHVSWAGWTLRVGFGREGLVLYDVRFEDRPILYRASIADLIVPYGDPTPGLNDYGPHDVGEWPWAKNVNSLELGCDCLGAIHYFDVAACDAHGHAQRMANAICMHEEDAGVLWKHLDHDLGRYDVRRDRRLVVSSFFTLGNYEYGLYWNLHLDGTIEFEAKLTGIVFPAATADDDPEWGELVAPGVYGPIHQHFFCARLDFDLDGVANSVAEVDTELAPAGAGNPFGNAFRSSKTVLEREGDAGREIDPRRGRYWLVLNEGRRNRLGRPVGYKLMPGDTVYPMAAPESDLHRRGEFLSKQLRVTRYADGELLGAGDYPNQRADRDGVLAYQAQDRPLRDEDVVLWYSFGAHHIVRPEDWPVMPVTKIGFMLRPVGFFDVNPAMRIPESDPHGSCRVDGDGDGCHHGSHDTPTDGGQR